METRYPPEVLDGDYDDGTMPASLSALGDAVIGRCIVDARQVIDGYRKWNDLGSALVLTLDDGTKAILRDTNDCCAYTELNEFLMHPTAVDHVIIGVGSTEEFTRWHIYADMGDVLELRLGWSCGNPFYYGYGFNIEVVPA